VKSAIPMNTFMAILLDHNALAFSSRVNVGYGSHLSVSVAAVRAITEAAQARLAFIHGAREDLVIDMYQDSHQEVYDFYDRIQPSSDWRALTDRAGTDLLDDYHKILHWLCRAGYRKIFRVDMTRAPFNIPVVKVWIPGFVVDSNLF
jgi:Uncharacterized conserved protein